TLSPGDHISAIKAYKPGLAIVKGNEYSIVGQPSKKEIDDIEEKLRNLDFSKNAELSKRDEGRLLNEVHKETDNKYKNFKLDDPAIESYFKNSEDKTKKALSEIRKGYKEYNNNNGTGLKQKTAEAKGEAYRILRVHKLEGLDDKKIEEWNENKIREKIRSSEAIAKDLEAMLREILK
ncbi:9159_t:CDS:2, partial [Entrophospora sp. SA101]